MSKKPTKKEIQDKLKEINESIEFLTNGENDTGWYKKVSGYSDNLQKLQTIREVLEWVLGELYDPEKDG
jgi:hypothetical protein